MKLNRKNLAALAPEVEVPVYDPSTVRQGIAHIGVGGFHRAHQAIYTEALLNRGEAREWGCLLYTSPSPRDLSTSRMPSSA